MAKNHHFKNIAKIDTLSYPILYWASLYRSSGALASGCSHLKSDFPVFVTWFVGRHYACNSHDVNRIRNCRPHLVSKLNSFSPIDICSQLDLISEPKTWLFYQFKCDFWIWFWIKNGIILMKLNFHSFLSHICFIKLFFRSFWIKKTWQFQFQLFSLAKSLRETENVCLFLIVSNGKMQICL